MNPAYLPTNNNYNEKLFQNLKEINDQFGEVVGGFLPM